VHLGRGLKLFEPGRDRIAPPSAREPRKLIFKPKLLIVETLLERVWVGTFSHHCLSVVEVRGCSPSDPVAQ
jgi:hypothetical protein